MKLLQDELIKRGMDFALFATYEDVNPNLFYLTGYVGAGVLIVLPKDNAILHVPLRDLTEAEKTKNVDISYGKKLSEVLESKGLIGKKAGIDFSNISVRDFNLLKDSLKCEFFDLTDFMNDLRMIKNKDEIYKIKKACKITDNIISKFIKNFKNFKTEEEASAFLVYETRKIGCDIAFEPIVASGKNASIPHHIPMGKIHKGFCVIDFGVKYKGYCSDVSRTFYIGKPSENEKKIYYDLLKIQQKAISSVKPGNIIAEVGIGCDKDLGKPLIHGLGHGIGIEVHELPYVSNSNKSFFKEGMVLTIEPGVYVENKYGLRIEDDVLVNSKGCEVLSKFSKNLICI